MHQSKWMPVKTTTSTRLRANSSGKLVPTKAVWWARSNSSLSPERTWARSSVDQRVVPLLFFWGEFAVGGKGVELGLVEHGLRVVIAKQGVTHPVERDKVVGFASGGEDLEGGGQASALVMSLGVLHSAGAVERIRLADRNESRRAGKDLAEVEALPMRCELRDQVQVIGLLSGFGGGRSGVISGDRHDGLSIWVRGSRDFLRCCSAGPRGRKWL